MFCAEKGNGAYLNNSRIRVSNKKNLRDALLVTGGPKYTSEIKDEIFAEFVNISKSVPHIRKFGSAALDIAYVACGRFDGSWQWELSYWDVAASIIIVKEAGGYVDFVDLQAKESVKRNVIATNSVIHDELKNNILKKIIE